MHKPLILGIYVTPWTHRWLRVFQRFHWWMHVAWLMSIPERRSQNPVSNRVQPWKSGRKRLEIGPPRDKEFIISASICSPLPHGAFFLSSTSTGCSISCNPKIPPAPHVIAIEAFSNLQCCRTNKWCAICSAPFQLSQSSEHFWTWDCQTSWIPTATWGHGWSTRPSCNWKQKNGVHVPAYVARTSFEIGALYRTYRKNGFSLSVKSWNESLSRSPSSTVWRSLLRFSLCSTKYKPTADMMVMQ